jgi:hypothetical protein
MKYSSGPQVPTMPKDGPDSVEVRSRAGDALGCLRPSLYARMHQKEDFLC